MCGRYTLTKAAHLRLKLEEAGYHFDEFSHTRFAPRFNVAPTQRVPVILNESPKKVSIAKWGLLPFWVKDEKIGASMINARCESVATKPAFRSAFKKRRCLIPADGFYEWAKTTAGKIPNWFRMADERVFYFAGLWETWNNPSGEKVRTCSIVTTGPNELVAPFHDRMPVILPPEGETVWMDAQSSVEALEGLLRPFAAPLMNATVVSTEVNKAANDYPELVAPLPPGGPNSA